MKNRNMRKLAAVACALALAAASTMPLVGCSAPAQQQEAQSSADAGASAGDGGLTPLTFVLDWTPNTNHTGVYVAIDKGYYADAGLKVSVVQPPEGDADALVGAGQAQLGVGYQDVMANYLGSADPLPVTAIASIVQHNTSGIMSRAGEGADRPRGLSGKRYGTWDQDVEKAMLKSVVEKDGGSWDDVELIPAGTSDELGGLRSDLFDAVWVYEAWAYQNAAVQDYPVDYFSFRDIDETFDYYTPVIIANDEWLAENPEAARAFLEATAKGYADAAEDPDEAAGILVEAAPELDPELVLASQRYLASRYVDDAPQWGYIDPARWDRFYAWMNDEGLVPVAIEPSAGFTNEYLPEA